MKMVPRVSVASEVLDWLSGSAAPTFKQIDNISKATHMPVGFFYLDKPVKLGIPIPDYRRKSGAAHSEPSPDVLDVIHASQLRQSWYREYVRRGALKTVTFVDSASTDEDLLRVAAQIRSLLRISTQERARIYNFAEMLHLLRERIEESGSDTMAA